MRLRHAVLGIATLGIHVCSSGEQAPMEAVISQYVSNTSCKVANVMGTDVSPDPCLEEVLSSAKKIPEQRRAVLKDRLVKKLQETNGKEEVAELYKEFLQQPYIVAEFPELRNFPTLYVDGKPYVVLLNQGYELFVRHIFYEWGYYLLDASNATNTRVHLFRVLQDHSDSKLYDPQILPAYSRVETQVKTRMLELERDPSSTGFLTNNKYQSGGFSLSNTAAAVRDIQAVYAKMLVPKDSYTQEQIEEDLVRTALIHEQIHVEITRILSARGKVAHPDIHLWEEWFAYTAELAHSTFPHAQLVNLVLSDVTSHMGFVGERHVRTPLLKKLRKQIEAQKELGVFETLRTKISADISDKEFRDILHKSFKGNPAALYEALQEMFTLEDIAVIVKQNFDEIGQYVRK